MLPESLDIPLDQLRGRLAELPRDRMIVVDCADGQRGHPAVRMFRQNGFGARNVSGGWRTLSASYPARGPAAGPDSRARRRPPEQPE